MENILRKKNKIDIINVASQLRTKGIYSFQKISYAQIEPDGQLTVVCDDKEMPSVIVIKEGKPRHYELNEIEKDEAWLSAEIARHGIELENIFLGEFWQGKLMFILKDGSVVK